MLPNFVSSNEYSDTSAIVLAYGLYLSNFYCPKFRQWDVHGLSLWFNALTDAGLGLYVAFHRRLHRRYRRRFLQ